MRDDYKRHVWMVQTRDSRLSVEEKVSDGYWQLVDLEWHDALKQPVWGKRALWHERELKNQWTETRIVKVEI